MVINEQRGNVLAASFSPDGSAIAFSTSDGEVRFYTINFQLLNEGDEEDADGDEEGKEVHIKPKCVEQMWSPHEGKPVTSIYFLDDHKVSFELADEL